MVSERFVLPIHTPLHVGGLLCTNSKLRRKGEKGTLKVLYDLDAIWISHKYYLLFNVHLSGVYNPTSMYLHIFLNVNRRHADHTCGLWRLLCIRREALCSSHVGSEVATTLHHPHYRVRSSPTLLLIAPSPVLEWIGSCEAAEAHCSRGSLSYTAVDPFLHSTWHLPGADLESVPVEHCYRAYGLVVRLKVCGKTVVYRW